MSKSIIVDTSTNWVTGAGILVGDTGFGVLGSAIPSTGDNGPGYAYSDLSLPADNNTEICGRITTWPTHGTLVAYEDTSFVYTATSDGADSFTYQLYKGGVASGSPQTVTLQVGSVNATANGATLTGASSMIGGGASGSGSVSAPGATLAATSSISGGAASGTNNVTASGAALTGTSAIQSGIATGSAPFAPITVPASRTAVFATNPRVVVFGTGTANVKKSQADQLYYVGDVSKDLSDSATSISSVAIIVQGVTLLEGPSIQGNLIVVKLGGLDTTPGAVNSCTFRVTTASGEQFDRTIHFDPIADTSWVFGKDPDDIHWYAADFTPDVTNSGYPLSSVGSLTPVGVNALAGPTIQGNKVLVKLSGLDVSSSAVNSCAVPVTLTNSEVIVRTMYFSRVDN